jgi:hypothetical protein
MRSTRGLSSDRCSYLWSLIFPSRPELTTVTLSRRTQRHSYADAPDRASKCLSLLSPSAGILAAGLLFTSPLAGFFCLESTSSARNLSRAESTDRLAEFIAEASDRLAVPARWIRAVIQIESGGDEHAISPRGAMGLMQLMPGTWVELGVRYGLGLDPFDPRDNAFAGTAYLKEMHDRSGSAGSLRPTTRVRRGTSITSQQGNHFHRTPWPMSLQSHHCSATNMESAPHLAAGVQFLGGSLRCLLAASTHPTDYRCASVMLQHRNSLFSSRRVFHAKTVPAELSLHPLNKDQPQ